MSFWGREIAGWVLVALGLLLFSLCVAILLAPGPHLMEAGPLSLIGIFVFRGGLHLVKVATAARVAMRSQQLAQRQEMNATAPARVLAERRR